MARIREDSPGILDTVVMARDFESTIHHDKIFALWNLAQDTDGMDFKLDYSNTLSHTYLAFATAVVKKAQVWTLFVQRSLSLVLGLTFHLGVQTGALHRRPAAWYAGSLYLVYLYLGSEI